MTSHLRNVAAVVVVAKEDQNVAGGMSLQEAQKIIGIETNEVDSQKLKEVSAELSTRFANAFERPVNLRCCRRFTTVNDRCFSLSMSSIAFLRLQVSKSMFELNDEAKGGSIYLQAKIIAAQFRLEEALRKGELTDTAVKPAAPTTTDQPTPTVGGTSAAATSSTASASSDNASTSTKPNENEKQ